MKNFGSFVFFLIIQIEWTENDIHTFTEALEKFHDDWTQIANYVHRSEQMLIVEERFL